MKNKSLKKFAAGGILFCALATGWLYREARPTPAVMIIPSRSGLGLISARGEVCLASPENISELPSLALILARLRPTRLSWYATPAPGAAPKGVRGLSLDGPESAPPPVWDGGDKIFAARPGGKLKLFNTGGKEIAAYAFPGGEIRDLSLSRDGKLAAVSLISGKRGLANSPFKLFVIDASLKNVTEIDVGGIYPMLTPGATEWGADGALYFSGFDRDDHEQRHTYRADPSTGKAEPEGRDWGPVFSISPDGAIAASAQWRGLALTNTITGVEAVIATPELRPIATIPAWSPDGKRVAFMLNPRPAPGGKSAGPRDLSPRVMIANLTGEYFSVSGKPIPNFNCGSCRPVWTPDGRYVLFNGYSYENRSSTMAVRRIKTLAADARSGEVSYPEKPELIWK